MPVSRFVDFHDVSEQGFGGLPAPTFAVMVARGPEGTLLVHSRHRKVWELPGGLVDPGESPRQAAERELVEESGCVARDTRWLGLMEVNDGQRYFGAVLRCDAADIPAQFENIETVAIGFWNSDSAPRPLGQADEVLLRRFG